jgi:hypothetical protein
VWLQGVPPVVLNAILLVIHRGEQARYRVAWVGERETRWEGQVGLECVEPEKRIFGDDLFTSPDYVYYEYQRLEEELRLCERGRSQAESKRDSTGTHAAKDAERPLGLENRQAQIRTLRGLLHYLCLVLEDPH